jgi:hypothetical protein
MRTPNFSSLTLISYERYKNATEDVKNALRTAVLDLYEMAALAECLKWGTDPRDRHPVTLERLDIE